MEMSQNKQQKMKDSETQKKISRPQLPPSVFVVIMKYMSLGDLMKSIMLLNKEIRDAVITQNYILFKQLLRFFNMHKRMKRGNIPPKQEIIAYIKNNVLASKVGVEMNLEPFCYATNGGTYSDINTYFLHNIFSKTNICHSTTVPRNANILAYLGRKVSVSPVSINPAICKPFQTDPSTIVVPYEQYLADSEERDSLKQLKTLILHNLGSGYTCFVSAMAIFTSEQEISISKSAVLKKFDNVNTEELFQNLNLPLKEMQGTKASPMNIAYEIDLSSPKEIESRLGIPKLDCFPIMWIYSSPKNQDIELKFSQRIGCRFLVLKLIDSHKQSSADNNIDMYNMTLRGVPLRM